MELRRYHWLALCAFLVFTTAAAALAVGRVNHVAQAQEELRDQPFNLAEALLRAHESAHFVHAGLRDQVIAGDLREASDALTRIAQFEAKMQDALAEVVREQEHEPETLAPLLHATSEWRATRERVGQLLIAGRWSDASYVYHTDSEQAYRALHAAMARVMEAERKHAAKLRQDALAAQRSASMAALALAVMAGGAMAALAVAVAVFVRFHRPLARLRTCLLSLAGGDAAVTIPYLLQNGPVGDIARAIDGFRRSLNERDAAIEALQASDRRTRQAMMEARAAIESKSRFLAAASHDLRQPLQALRLFLDTLDTRLTDRLDRRILAGATDALGAGEELLRNYLDVSVLEAGILEPQIGNVALKPLMDDVLCEFTPDAMRKGLAVKMLPTEAVVRSDRALLRRLLRNLVANAVRYTETGGVLIGFRKRGTMLRVEIWDTGIGIPADKLQAVFEDFYQVGNPERDRKRGLGLGLSVVDRAARLLGHQVTARSCEGRGSVFTVTLPLVRDLPDARAAA